VGTLEILGNTAGLAWVCALCAGAGFAHGLSGFGFPVISTPVVALFTDVRAAVLVTLFPNIAVNLAGAFTGAGWRASLARHWRMPLWVLLGTVAGSQVVLYAPQQPLRLLLAAIIVVYLKQDSLRLVDWSVIRRRPGLAGFVAGITGGFLSGTVNVMLPPLLIYFTTLGLAPLVMTQVLNACFLVGKASQASVFALAGQVSWAGLALTAVPSAAALAGYAAGRRLQARIAPSSYRAFIRAVLWVIAALLLAQVAWGVAGTAFAR
jgi:uncharacterized membrane protein YfcA